MSAKLVFRSLGRVMWFAFAGALCMAIVGIVAGAIAGGAIVGIGIFLQRNAPYTPQDFEITWLKSVEIGAYVVFVVGSIAALWLLHSRGFLSV